MTEPAKTTEEARPTTPLATRLLGDPSPDGIKGLIERSGTGVFLALLLTVLCDAFVGQTNLIEALRTNAQELLTTLLVALGLARNRSYR